MYVCVCDYQYTLELHVDRENCDPACGLAMMYVYV